MRIFSKEQVLALAPGAAAARAGQGQAVLVRWPTRGHDEQAAWGECQGSGAAPYRCQAALADGTTRCSCPSRKLPCKHAAVWGKAPDLGNFRRKVLGTEGFVIEARRSATAAPAGGRPALMYRRGDAVLLHPPMLRPHEESRG